MRDFDLTQLRTFVAVAEAGSVSAAASKIFLSQSTVSEQIKKLEERAGQPLLLRSKKGTQPTPAGEKLLGYARRILALSEAALEDLQGRALDGELRIAITDYFRPTDIARILKRFAEQHPRLRLHVTVQKSAAIERSADEGEFDIGLSMRMVGEDGRHLAGGMPWPQSTVVRRERMVWVSHPDYAEISPPQQPLPLVVLPNCALQGLILSLLERNKLTYLIAHTASGVAGLQLALGAGLGISCLNESAIGPGLAECPAEMGLPALPIAEFSLLPAQPGEGQLVSDARAALIKLFK
ncbi:LysR family transcriptional regulator [Andreprevotia chitinilytica]|uniref:LysR family transcriptional regulator n=1 Tax=Andreprevotia chitinilytica TaxID=396808 RepID=UPI000558508A|nr:LysR family transcriptional regulator [Andreprevotia chitinilytica]